MLAKVIFMKNIYYGNSYDIYFKTCRIAYLMYNLNYVNMYVYISMEKDGKGVHENIKHLLFLYVRIMYNFYFLCYTFLNIFRFSTMTTYNFFYKKVFFFLMQRKVKEGAFLSFHWNVSLDFGFINLKKKNQ